MRHTESQRQQAVIYWFGFAHRGLGVPDARLLFAIPNGGARSQITGAVLKKEGVRAGVPDLFLAVPNIAAGGRYHGLFVEMKTWAGRPTPAQLHMMKLLREQGYDCRVAHSSDQARRAICSYLEGKESDI